MKEMDLPADFFAGFPPVDKETWLRHIAASLKDKPLESLDWHPASDLKVDPFAFAPPCPPLPPLSDAPNHWEICESVAVADPAAANRQALDALEGGAEGLTFHFTAPPAAADMDVLMQGVFPDYIGLHFAGPGTTHNPGTVLANLERLAGQRGIALPALRGSLHYDPAAGPGIADWRYAADLMAYAKDALPGFRILTLSAGADALTLGEGLKRAARCLEKLSERGIPAGQAAAQMQFSMTVGKNYFLEIARIRAFKLLWINILKAWGATPVYPLIAVEFHPDAYTDDLYGNMIAATTMAMSAVQGGADRLTVLPCDAGREAQSSYPPAFGRRIARNVQHLMKLESGLDRTADPAAGSYYIEKLTGQLAERGWKAFSEPED